MCFHCSRLRRSTREAGQPGGGGSSQQVKSGAVTSETVGVVEACWVGAGAAH
jgi:hypothetical protein